MDSDSGSDLSAMGDGDRVRGCTSMAAVVPPPTFVNATGDLQAEVTPYRGPIREMPGSPPVAFSWLIVDSRR